MTETVRFETVKQRRIVDGTCPVCHRPVRRSRVFSQTINPFNKNEDGTMKTYGEVKLAVEAEAFAWEPDFRHEACKDA